MTRSLISIIYIYIFSLITVVSLSKSANDFTMTITSLKPESKPASRSTDSSRNQLEDYRLASRYFDTILKKFHLDDGRTVTCKVPLIKEEEIQWKKLGNLTKEQMQSVLIHFKDSCVRHRTKDFLWEFCYGKYVRQYDDVITIANAHKREAELFFLGFYDPAQSWKFTSQIDTRTGDYDPEREYFDKEIRLPLGEDKYIQTFGRVVRLSSVESITNNKALAMYALEVYVPAKELIDKNIVVNIAGERLGDYLGKEKKALISMNVDGQLYIKLQRFIKMIVGTDTLILEEEFPFDIATEQAEILIYIRKDNTEKKNFLGTQIYNQMRAEFFLYKNLLYGTAAFLTEAESSTAIILIFQNKTITDRLILSVLDDSVIELDQSIEGSEPLLLKHIALIPTSTPLVQDLRWTYQNKRIWLLGTVILGNDTSFTQEFKKGDIMFLINADKGLTEPTYAREILKVVNDKIMIARPFKSGGTVPAVSFESYLIGKYEDLKKKSEELLAQRKKRLYKEPTIKHLNTAFITPVAVEKSIYLLQNTEENNDNLTFCHKNHYLMNPESWLVTFKMTFIMLTVDSPQKSNLLLHFGPNECSPEGVEVNFYHMQKVIVNNHGEKANFMASPIKIEGVEESEDLIWILFHDGVLRVGKGEELSLANQLIFFEPKKYTKLSYFSINKMFSFNMVLDEIQIAIPSKSILETIKVMADTPVFEGSGSYFEDYTGGTMCDAIGKERSVEVEYKCGLTGDFLKIEDINEPSTCHYHLVVESNLLCPDEYKRSHKHEELATKINCVI